MRRFSLAAEFTLVVCLFLFTGCEARNLDIIPHGAQVPVGTTVVFITYPERVVSWALSADIGTLSVDIGSATQFEATKPGFGFLNVHLEGWTTINLPILVYVPVPTTINIDQEEDWSITHGDTKDFSAILLDQYGNQMPSIGFTWSIANGPGTFSPNPSPNTSFTAGDPGSSPISAAITASYNSLTSDACSGTISRQLPILSYIQISPSPPWSVPLDRPQPASVMFYDQYGNRIWGYWPKWSCSPPYLGYFVPADSDSTIFFPISSGIGIGTISAGYLSTYFQIVVTK